MARKKSIKITGSIVVKLCRTLIQQKPKVQSDKGKKAYKRDKQAWKRD